MDPREQVQRQIDEAVASIRNVSEQEPEIGVVLGSGLAEAASAIDSSVSISYENITHFALSTVSGHPGNLVFGRIANKNIVILQGRFHYYEGYTMWGITFPIRVLADLGVKALIITGACGGLRTEYSQGDLVLLNDHINLMPANPLIGPHIFEMGARFIDMSEPYSHRLARIAKNAAKQSKIDLKQGVYAAMAGPQYETKAEVNMLNKLGADVVGMSVVPEVIVARQSELEVLGLCIVSNQYGEKKLISHEQVLENVGKSRASFVKLFKAVIEKI